MLRAAGALSELGSQLPWSVRENQDLYLERTEVTPATHTRTVLP